MVFGDTKSKNVNTGCTYCHASPAETRVKSVPVWHVQTQTKTKGNIDTENTRWKDLMMKKMRKLLLFLLDRTNYCVDNSLKLTSIMSFT